MLQREVAAKIAARPGDEGYGPLSLAAAMFGEIEIVITLEPHVFFPRPPVTSAVVAFRRKPPALDVPSATLWTAIKGLFNHRRKTIANGVKSLGAFVKNGESSAAIIAQAGLAQERRPETLSLQEFAAIVKACGY